MKKNLFIQCTAFFTMLILISLSLWPLGLMIYTSFKTRGTLTDTISRITIDNFDIKNHTNLLGGKHSTFSTLDSRSSLEYINDDNVSGKNTLAIHYNNKSEGKSYYRTRISQEIRDIKSLEFMFKTMTPTSKIKIAFVGTRGNKTELSLTPYINTSHTDWQKVVIPINDFDLSKIDSYTYDKRVENLIYVFGDMGEGVVFLDNIELKLKKFVLHNFRSIIVDQKFGKYFINSLIIAICVTIGNIFFCSMVGYTFARKKFFGKNLLFFFIMATMMIPPQVFMIPMFILMKNINWLNTYLALIVPALVAPFNIFLMRQYISRIPQSMEDIARIDGASEFQIFFRIIMPMSKPALTIVGINTFMGSWNTFLYPFLLTNTPELRTLPVGLALYKSIQGIDWPHLMAGSTLTAIPVIMVFLLFQKYIIAGITPERSHHIATIGNKLKGFLDTAK